MLVGDREPTSYTNFLPEACQSVGHHPLALRDLGRAGRDGRRGAAGTNWALAAGHLVVGVRGRPAARSRAADASGEVSAWLPQDAGKLFGAAIGAQWHHSARAEPNLLWTCCLCVHSDQVLTIGGLHARPNPDLLCARCPCAGASRYKPTRPTAAQPTPAMTQSNWIHAVGGGGNKHRQENKHSPARSAAASPGLGRFHSQEVSIS